MEEDFKGRVISGRELLDADFTPDGLYLIKTTRGIEYRFEPVAAGWYNYVGERELTEGGDDKRNI